MKRIICILTAGVLILSAMMTAACGLIPSRPDTEESADSLTKPDQPAYTVTVVYPRDCGILLSGGSALQTVTHREDFVPITVSTKGDYRYEGYEIDGVTYTDDTIRLPQDPTAPVTVNILVSRVMQEPPVIRIHTDGTPVDSKEYVDMTLSLTGTDSPLVNVGGEIRLRGNSTYSLPKKPYRIKLDQKHSFFGLDKAKSWVLLADYLDPSALHNYAALTLAGTSEYFDFVPTPYKVSLYLNDEYMGLYTLCEQIQEQEGRLDLECEITPDMTDARDFNFLICMNYNAPEKPGAEEGVTYFYLSNCERYFELEYPKREDFASEEQFRAFFDSLESFIRDTSAAYLKGDLAYIKKHTDVNSLIDLFIIDEIMGERDHHWKSFFLYYRGADGDGTDTDKLCFGPPWDYDFCMLCEWTGQPNEEYEIKNTLHEYELNFFYQPLLSRTSLNKLVKSRYQNHFAAELDRVIEQVQERADTMPNALEQNQERWYADKPTITEDNIEFFIRYLKARKAYLNRVWGA